MLNLINKETRQIPSWTVVQGRGVDRVRSNPATPTGMGDSGGNFTVSCIPEPPSLALPVAALSKSKATRYVRHIRARQSHIMIAARRINRMRAEYRDALLKCHSSFPRARLRSTTLILERRKAIRPPLRETYVSWNLARFLYYSYTYILLDFEFFRGYRTRYHSQYLFKSRIYFLKYNRHWC